MFWFRMNDIRDNRQASKDERFSETGREIYKDIVAPKKPSQIPVARKDCQIVLPSQIKLLIIITNQSI